MKVTLALPFHAVPVRVLVLHVRQSHTTSFKGYNGSRAFVSKSQYCICIGVAQKPKHPRGIVKCTLCDELNGEKEITVIIEETEATNNKTLQYKHKLTNR